MWGFKKNTYYYYISNLKGCKQMNICERVSCGNWSNKFKNKCDVMTAVPLLKCDSYMSKEAKDKLEKIINKARNEGM